MWLPTKAQVDSISRHAITAASTAIMIFGLQSKGVSVEQVTATIQALGSTVNNLVLFIGAAGALYASLKASHSASPTSQINSASAIAQDPSNPNNAAAATALISGVRKIAEQSVIPAPIDESTLESTARQVGNVVQLQLGKDAKAALIDAAAAQPEVVGDIHVTDPALAQATVSPQVKAA